MNRQEHHAEAEQLLEQARAEQESLRRTLILAEAQVHATLARSAPAGEDPAGPEQPDEEEPDDRGEEEPGGRGKPRSGGFPPF